MFIELFFVIIYVIAVISAIMLIYITLVFLYELICDEDYGQLIVYLLIIGFVIIMILAVGEHMIEYSMR